MWIGTRNLARVSAVSGLRLCFKKAACLGAGSPFGSSRRCPVCSEDRLVPWVELGWRPWGLSVRCRAAPGKMPGPCPRVAGRARLALQLLAGPVAVPQCHPAADAAARAWVCLGRQQPWSREAPWLLSKAGEGPQPQDLDALYQGWGGDAEGTGTALLCTSLGSHGGGGASPSCTGGHAVPGHGTGGMCLAATAIFPGRSSGVAVSAGLSSELGLGEGGRGLQSERTQAGAGVHAPLTGDGQA